MVPSLRCSRPVRAPFAPQSRHAFPPEKSISIDPILYREQDSDPPLAETIANATGTA
jgi:hypothetical protein